MSNLSLIQPQRVDFNTAQSTDWLDGLPMIGTSGLGGVLAGPANVGNGALTVQSVRAQTAYGAHFVRVTGIVFGIAQVSVVDPSGTLTGTGVVGVPLSAGGLVISIAQGATAFTVGDLFAVGVMPAPVDLTGLRFDLDARLDVGLATVALRASSGDAPPTIANGGGTGTIAMAVPRATMAACPVKRDGYPYAITATDPVTGLVVPAFYGRIFHVATAALIGQG